MENCDYFIVTDDFLLIKFINDGWKEFDLQQFVEHDIRKNKLSTSEKKKLLTKVIKNIKKERYSSLLSRLYRKKMHAVVLYSFNAYENLIIDIYDYLLYSKMHYSKITNCSIALAAVGISEIDKEYIPIIVVSAISGFIELALCFTGEMIIKHTCNGIFQSEYKYFYNECLKIREKTLISIMDLSCFPLDISDKTSKIWNAGRDFKIIVVTNKNEFDYQLTGFLNVDSYINLCDEVELVEKLIQV